MSGAAEESSSSGGGGMVLVTANVGSLFEFYDQLMEPWLQSIKKMIRERDPSMVMLHLQEMGGKRVDESIVNDIALFFRHLQKFMSQLEFEHCMIYYDDDVTNKQQCSQYTALGVACFQRAVQRSNDKCAPMTAHFEPFNFETNAYESCPLNEPTNPATSSAQFVRKEKYPLNMCSGRSFRKGHVISRWRGANNNDRCFNLVNLHLFHDASNLVAMELDPSVYALRRSLALRYTMDRLLQLDTDIKAGKRVKPVLNNSNPDIMTCNMTGDDVIDTVQGDGDTLIDDDGTPTFYFGDFNFRLALKSFLRNLVEESPVAIETVVSYTNNNSASSNGLSPVSQSQSQELSPTWSVDSPAFSIDTSGHQEADVQVALADLTLVQAAGVRTPQISPSASMDVSSWGGMLAPPDMLKKRTSSDSSDYGAFEQQANQYDYVLDESGDLQLRVKRKLFDWRSDGSNDVTIRNRHEWLQQFDGELHGCFDGQLFECPIHFLPSYPRAEPSTSPATRAREFMLSRAPAWCDRVLMNNTAWHMISDVGEEGVYDLLGADTPTGDHKPVCLFIADMTTR